MRDFRRMIRGGTRLAAALMLAALALPAGAETEAETTQTLPPQCLSAADAHGAVSGHGLIPQTQAIAAARLAAPGDIVSARLCETKRGMIYMLVLLDRNGQVRRVTVDAKNAEIVSKR